MFCSHCGKEVTVGAKFCPNCGAAIESQPAPVGEQPKAPAVERTEPPIKKLTESGGQPKTGKRLIPKPLVIVAAALVLFIGIGAVLNLFGSDDKPTLEPSGSHTTQEESVPYREFNAEEFLSGNALSGAVMYIGSDKGGESTAIGNAVTIEYKTDVFNKNFSDVVKNNDAGWETIKKCLENDWFNSESKCAELDYISEVQWKNKSYDYFRLNVTDLIGLNSKFAVSPDWTNGNEIYMIAEVSAISDSWVDELQERIQIFNIQFYINQFDERTVPTPSQSTNDVNEPVNSTGTVLVETDYYTIEIPQEWEKYCSCEKLPGAGEYFLTFYIKDEYLERHSGDNVLLKLAAIPGPEFFPEYYNSGEYSYICQICEYRASVLNLMQRTTDDIQIKEEYNELLMTLQEYVPYVIQSIKAIDGYTLSYEPIEIDDGIPYVPNAWIDMIGQPFAPTEFYQRCGDHPHDSFCPIESINVVDNVTYYQLNNARYYGVEDGLIVAYMEFNYECPEVYTVLSSDFDGIEPKIVMFNQCKYLIWEVNNGYVIFWVIDTGYGYLHDLIRADSFCAYKEMFTSN